VALAETMSRNDEEAFWMNAQKHLIHYCAAFEPLIIESAAGSESL
jgi:hypothetical protein